MNGKQVKLLRKQVRNVAQQTLPDILKAEALVETAKSLTELIGAKLETVAENVGKELARIDTQTQTFRGMVMRDASMQITKELFNINCTMLAWQQVLLGELGISDVEAFDAKVEAKKSEIEAKLIAEAEAEEAARKKAAEEAKAAEAAKKAAEAPATSTEPPAEAGDG